MRKLMSAAAFMILAFQAPASAADICEAVALRDVPAEESPNSILRRGEIDGAVTQYQLNKKTGRSLFCSHGGYCYPTFVIENGRKVEALRELRNYGDTPVFAKTR